ncbi:unnamed protein product [Orchesella dallaii]|uniref:Protein sleepless n=1 Tax=Orchesella dallaii TaxID=48710 RepID=A0ABP1RRD2_9HEXA
MKMKIYIISKERAENHVIWILSNHPKKVKGNFSCLKLQLQVTGTSKMALLIQSSSALVLLLYLYFVLISRPQYVQGLTCWNCGVTGPSLCTKNNEGMSFGCEFECMILKVETKVTGEIEISKTCGRNLAGIPNNECGRPFINHYQIVTQCFCTSDDCNKIEINGTGNEHTNRHQSSQMHSGSEKSWILMNPIVVCLVPPVHQLIHRYF